MLLIIIKCKNTKTIFIYLSFIFNCLKKIFKKINKITKKIIKITILKSPHVHKKAQQQYEQQIVKKQILFISFDKIKLLVFFKNFINFIYQDINFNCYFVVKPNYFKFCFGYFKYYNTFLLNNFKKFKLKFLAFNQLKFYKLIKYFKLLNFMGKITYV